MASIIDPCNPFTGSSALTVMCIIICGVQIMGSEAGIGCFPYVDYLKFVTLFIIAYFAYVNGIKGKSMNCGMGALPMWSSICSSIIISSVILVAICARLRGGLASNIAYIPMLLLCCSTIMCTDRLFKTSGPFTGSFWDPTTLTTFSFGN